MLIRMLSRLIQRRNMTLLRICCDPNGNWNVTCAPRIKRSVILAMLLIVLLAFTLFGCQTLPTKEIPPVPPLNSGEQENTQQLSDSTISLFNVQIKSMPSPTLLEKTSYQPSQPTTSPKQYSVEDMFGLLDKPVTPAPDTFAPAVEDNPVVNDIPKLENLKTKFEMASKKTGVPVEIMAGIASRESHAGSALDPYGFDPDKRTAFGVMQVDKRYHKLLGTHDKKGRPTPDSQEHINQAAGIIRENKLLMDKRFPNWTEEQRWRAAAAGYNMGPGNVKTLENMDIGTTGNNYSKDVMERANAYKILKDRK